jgi:hypothetical protein
MLPPDDVGVAAGIGDAVAATHPSGALAATVDGAAVADAAVADAAVA